MADQARDTLPANFFLSEEEEAALAVADTAADTPLRPRVRNVGHLAVSVRRLGHSGRNTGGHHDTGGCSRIRVRLLHGVGSPGDLYQPHYSGSGNQWSGYASSAPATPMPSVLVRPGASDSQLLDGLSLLAPDVRQRLLTILHAMEHRQVGQARWCWHRLLGPRPTLRHSRVRAGIRRWTPPRTPKRRAFPEAQDFCAIACRIPGCDRLCGRPLTPRGHRNHVCRRCRRHR